MEGCCRLFKSAWSWHIPGDWWGRPPRHWESLRRSKNVYSSNTTTLSIQQTHKNAWKTKRRMWSISCFAGKSGKKSSVHWDMSTRTGRAAEGTSTQYWPEQSGYLCKYVFASLFTSNWLTFVSCPISFHFEAKIFLQILVKRPNSIDHDFMYKSNKRVL